MWFNQPAKKVARRSARAEKAAKSAPRPLNMLRPIARGQTIKYNLKTRTARGFTLAELKAAGINSNEARGIGVSVDHRRKNRSEESFQANVNRLKLYKSKLVLFPRKPTSKRQRKGDATREERQAVEQIDNPLVLSLPDTSRRVKPRAITKEERDRNVSGIIRKARTDGKLWGQREKRAKEKAEKLASQKAPAADE